MREKMEIVGGAMLRDAMPEQHRAFFPLLPTFFIGGSDEHGSIWASLLWGDPGFVQSPDPATLRIAARLQHDDPLAPVLQPGTPLGCLGLQFETRRRNRANGTVAALDAHGFTLAVQQSFGNCPKYIQTRELIAHAHEAAHAPAVVGGSSLPPAAAALIRQCDTFFIATAVDASQGAEQAGVGADMSHRGGKPGFVDIDTQGVLTWPDFQGNNLFNTIGNLTVDGRAGLLFIDFERGDLLQLSGHATVVWDGAEVERFPGAKRLLHFSPVRHVFRQGRLPLRWALREPSPHLEHTGVWERANR